LDQLHRLDLPRNLQHHRQLPKKLLLQLKKPLPNLKLQRKSMVKKKSLKKNIRHRKKKRSRSI